MSSAISSITKEVSRGISNYTVLGSLMGGDGESGDSTDYEAEAQQDAQDDATNAARVASNKKKKSTSSSVLTSPLGTSSTASTAVTKLGGM